MPIVARGEARSFQIERKVQVSRKSSPSHVDISAGFEAAWIPARLQLQPFSAGSSSVLEYDLRNHNRTRRISTRNNKDRSQLLVKWWRRA